MIADTMLLVLSSMPHLDAFCTFAMVGCAANNVS